MEKLKKIATIPAALGLMLGAGVLAGSASLAAAQTSGTTTPTQSTTRPHFDPSKGGHVGPNGATEVLLTGDQASTATQAALAANPGATIERVETDADGDAYEAHIVSSDGTHKTVKFDSSFNVTKTETGPGGPGGHTGTPQQNANTQ